MLSHFPDSAPDGRRHSPLLRKRRATVSSLGRDAASAYGLAVTASGMPNQLASLQLIWGVIVAFGLGASGSDIVVGIASAQVVTEVATDPNVAYAYHAIPITVPSHQTSGPSHRVIEAPKSRKHRSSTTGRYGRRSTHAAISPGSTRGSSPGSPPGASFGAPHGLPHGQSHVFSHHGDVVVPAPNEGVPTGPPPRRHAGSAELDDIARVPGAATPFGEWAGGVGARLIPRPPLSSLLQRLPASAATIPEARQTPVWKQPYSYGYFGASGKRHWSKHHSYRDNDTRWTLR